MPCKGVGPLFLHAVSGCSNALQTGCHNGSHAAVKFTSRRPSLKARSELAMLTLLDVRGFAWAETGGRTETSEIRPEVLASWREVPPVPERPEKSATDCTDFTAGSGQRNQRNLWPILSARAGIRCPPRWFRLWARRPVFSALCGLGVLARGSSGSGKTGGISRRLHRLHCRFRAAESAKSVADLLRPFPSSGLCVRGYNTFPLTGCSAGGIVRPWQARHGWWCREPRIT